MRKAMAAPVLFLVLLIAGSAPLAQPQETQAFDPQVHVAKAALAAFKARFHDRAVGFRTVAESQAAAVAILEQKKAQAQWAADKGYITQAQAQAVSSTLDQVVVSMEELAKQERRMVRNDTRFLKTFVRNIAQTLRDAAPQALAEQFGLPPLGARAVGSIIQGEKPATAVLDALITKLQGGELVEPSKEPFADLLTQVDALQEAASVLRGADRVKMLSELFRVRERLEEITDLPIPEQSNELDKLHDFFDEAEATLGELGEVRDEWIPQYSGPNSDRFRNNPQWQEIWAEIVALQESPDARVKGAVAAGMSLTALEKVKEELIAQGIDPDSEDLDRLAAQIIHERILAEANNKPISVEEAVKSVLSDGTADPDEPGGDPDDADDGDKDGDTIPNASDLCPERPENFDGVDDHDGCPDGEDDPDGDGVTGDADGCPDDPEDKDGFEDGDGCPDPDNDQDTILDTSDGCPNEPEDFDGFEDGDGCPDPDNDQDTILDTSDGCPNVAEDADFFEDDDGCPDPDNDQDDILDVDDDCPNVAEDINGLEDDDGCPDGDDDPDGDGIAGVADQCPNQAEDVDGFQDSDGCPDPDNDGDGILDASDLCRNEAEDPDGFEDLDGCPDPDNDRDTIPDTSDQCPNEAEDLDGVEDLDGCPEEPLPSRALSYTFPLGLYRADLNGVIDFSSGSVSGSFSGTWTQVSGQTNCGQGNQILDTAEAHATARFSTGFSGSVPQGGGSYSAPVGFSGTISYALAKPFTHPSCTHLNGQAIAQLPATSTFTASGTISGTAIDGSPTTINVNTTLGSFAQ